jgi:hypothetical protein
MDNSYHGLAFLLSLGTLPIACTIEKGDSDSDGTTTGGPTTDNTGSGTTGTTGGSAGMTTGGTTTTEPTSGTSSPTTGGETETGGPLGPCEAYVAKLIMCEPDLDMTEELDGCEAERKQQEAIVGPTCAALFDEILLCFADAMCGDDAACEAEVDAAYACSPEVSPVCAAYGMKYGECFMQDPAETSKYCQTNINSVKYMVGPECGAAYEDYYVCMTGLDCAALEMGMGCEDKQTAIETACGF